MGFSPDYYLPYFNMSNIWIFFFLIFSLILSFILFILSYILGNKNPYRGKISAYECGFASIYQPTNPFTIKFFVVGIIFLIFDLEIIYLIPWSFSSSFFNIKVQLIVLSFVLFVVVGLIYEWVKGGLEWL